MEQLTRHCDGSRVQSSMGTIQSTRISSKRSSRRYLKRSVIVHPHYCSASGEVRCPGVPGLQETQWEMRNDGDLELVSASASFWSFPQFYMTYFPAERAPPLPHEPTAGMAPFRKDGVHWHVVQGHIWGKRTVEDTPAAVLHFPRRGYPASLSQRSCRRLTRAHRGRGRSLLAGSQRKR